MLERSITLPRIGAAAASVAVTEALLVLIRRPHTPAGTTTLLVSLGIFTASYELVSLLAGIVLVTVAAWIVNRTFGAPVPIWGPKSKGISETRPC